MARFLLSPGVVTREVDNSQYAATQPTGNVAALIGYAEKGPFEPTIVSGTQEFNRVFGYALADAPYLAQAAYKYFSQGQNLLVVRAGDDRDPDIYPQAAQYASKKVRLGERDVEATKGTQSFSRSSQLAAGTFAPGAEFGFELVADHRAFTAPKYVESWDVHMHETSNGLSVPSPAGTTNNFVLKAAFNRPEDSTFEINVKQDNVSGNNTEEKAGTATRAGTTFNSAVTGTAYIYAANGVAEDNRNKYVYFDGKYGAAVLGTQDMSSGFDWSATPQDIELYLDGLTYTVSLSLEAVQASEVVSHINSALTSAVDENANVVDLSGDLQAFVVTPESGTSYIGLRRHARSVAGLSADGFQISSSDAASTLGWVQAVYRDADSIYGVYHAENDSAGEIFDGNLLLVKKSSESGVESFEEPIDVAVTAPASGAWELSDIVSQIQSGLDAGHTDYINSPSRGSVSIDAATGKITIETDLAAEDGYRSMVRIRNNASNSLIDLLGVDNPQDGEQEKPIGEAVIDIRAAEKGSYGNKLVLRTETVSVTIAPGDIQDHYNAYVFLDGKEVSVYQRINWDDPTSSKFFPKILEDDQYIKMEAEDEDGNFLLAQLPDGDWALGNDDLPDGVSSLIANVVEFNVGTDGWGTDQDGVITTFNDDLIQGIKKLYNPEIYDFNLIAAPGGVASEVQNEIQTICESRHDCFGIIDAAPFGYGLGVKQNVNYVSEINGMNENLNSSYVGAYWPWLQDYDADNKQYVWLPPSIYALTQMVYTDNVADPWYATAGLSRGKVTALDVEYSPTRQERDILYGETNIINPIVKFVGEGIAIWGQKTAQRTKSALDRINVRRLMIYAEKLIARMARGFLFEQNDPANWAAFARQANAILEPIRQRRGLTTYQVVCDATTNTADLINQNIMAGKIFVQPTKTIEFIEVEFTINAAGDVEFTE